MWPDCARDPTGLALLHGAKQHPDETDRRRVLADWLEDQGEAGAAGCLRRSLAQPGLWTAFPDAVVRRWHPWTGCQGGWPGTNLRPDGPDDLPDSPWLCALNLYGNSLGDAGAEALARSPLLANLASLTLTRNGIGDVGVAALAGSSFLAGVGFLELQGNRIGAAGAEALARSPHLAGLTSLDLYANSVGDAGAMALAQSPHLANLTFLDLGKNDLSDAGAEALAWSPHLKKLTCLGLWDNYIFEAGEKALNSLRCRGVQVRT